MSLIGQKGDLPQTLVCTKRKPRTLINLFHLLSAIHIHFLQRIYFIWNKYLCFIATLLHYTVFRASTWCTHTAGEHSSKSIQWILAPKPQKKQLKKKKAQPEASLHKNFNILSKYLQIGSESLTLTIICSYQILNHSHDTTRTNKMLMLQL